MNYSRIVRLRFCYFTQLFLLLLSMFGDLSASDTTSNVSNSVLAAIFSNASKDGFVIRCSSETKYSQRFSSAPGGIEGDTSQYLYIQQGPKWRLDLDRQIKGLPDRRLQFSFDGKSYSQFRSADGTFMTSEKENMKNVPRSIFPLLEPFAQTLKIPREQLDSTAIKNGSMSFSVLPSDVIDPTIAAKLLGEFQSVNPATGEVRSKYIQEISVVSKFQKKKDGTLNLYPSSYKRILPDGKVALEIDADSEALLSSGSLPKSITIVRYMNGEEYCRTVFKIESIEFLTEPYTDFPVDPSKAANHYNLDKRISIPNNPSPGSANSSNK